MAAKIDMVDQVCGLLTVLREGGRTPGGKVKWWCRCECGAEVEVSGDKLRNGRVRSCGCLNSTNKRSFRQQGEKHPKWLGGKRNKGSEAHARSILKASALSARKRGYRPINLSPTELATIFSRHDGSCDSCGLSEKECYRRHCVDHCHETGEYRGILCNACNRASGYLMDCPERCRQLARFLEKSP